MRWNKAERTFGEFAVVVVLSMWFVTVENPGRLGSRLRPGMTQDGVAAVLGTPGRPHPTEVGFLNVDSPLAFRDAEAYEAYLRNHLRQNSRFYREYQFSFCAADVYFEGVEGKEEVASVKTRWAIGSGWYLVAWIGAAFVLGLLTTEVARRYRPVAVGEPAGQVAVRL